jgi:hypothetical protein
VGAHVSKLLDMGSYLREVLPESGPVLPMRRQILRAIVQCRVLLLQEAHLPLEPFVVLGKRLEGRAVTTCVSLAINYVRAPFPC